MWDVRLNKQLVLNKTLGVNEWGQVVLGQPIIYPAEAAEVYVYEALVYDYVLPTQELEMLISQFQQKYSTYFAFIH